MVSAELIQCTNAYVRGVNRTLGPALHPIIRPAVKPISRTMLADLIGFWILWHIEGGFEGLQRYGYSEATIYRKVKRFRLVFGQHPDEYEFPGVTIDPHAYWADAERRRAEREHAADPEA